MVAKATHCKAVPLYAEELGREVEPPGLNATQAAVMIALKRIVQNGGR